MNNLTAFRAALVVGAIALFLFSIYVLFVLGDSAHPNRYGKMASILNHLSFSRPWIERILQSKRPGSIPVVFARLVPVCAVISGSVVVLFWNRRTSYRARTGAYFAILIILMPLSAINYASGDRLMAVEVQVIVDLLMVFLGTSAIVFLVGATVDQNDLTVLKYLLIGGLAIGTVVMPGVYAVSFFLREAGVGRNSKHYSRSRDCNRIRCWGKQICKGVGQSPRVAHHTAAMSSTPSNFKEMKFAVASARSLMASSRGPVANDLTLR